MTRTEKNFVGLLFALTSISGIVLLIKKIKYKMIFTNIINHLPIGENGKWSEVAPDKKTDITIHHSATETGTPQTFANYHLKKWGRQIAYHVVIDKSGEAFQTNEFNVKSYHNGFNNTVAIGICLIGNFEVEQPTEEQIDKLKLVVAYLTGKFKNIEYLNSHGDYKNATKCCGHFLSVYIPEFRNLFGLKDRTIKIPFGTPLQMSKSDDFTNQMFSDDLQNLKVDDSLNNMYSKP